MNLPDHILVHVGLGITKDNATPDSEKPRCMANVVRCDLDRHDGAGEIREPRSDVMLLVINKPELEAFRRVFEYARKAASLYCEDCGTWLTERRVENLCRNELHASSLLVDMDHLVDTFRAIDAAINCADEIDTERMRETDSKIPLPSRDELKKLVDKVVQ